GDFQGRGAPRGEARLSRAVRGGGRALPGAAVRDPRRCLEGGRARPLGRASDLAPARDREHLARGRAAPLPAARPGLCERARPRRGLLPEPVPMIDTLRLTAEGAMELLRQGEVSGPELFAAYRVAIDERNHELNAYLTFAEDPGGVGVPIALKDVISTK